MAETRGSKKKIKKEEIYVEDTEGSAQQELHGCLECLSALLVVQTRKCILATKPKAQMNKWTHQQ